MLALLSFYLASSPSGQIGWTLGLQIFSWSHQWLSILFLMSPLIVPLIAHDIVFLTSGQTMILKWIRQTSECSKDHYEGFQLLVKGSCNQLKLSIQEGQHARSNHCTLVPCPRGKVRIMWIVLPRLQARNLLGEKSCEYTESRWGKDKKHDGKLKTGTWDTVVKVT